MIVRSSKTLTSAPIMLIYLTGGEYTEQEKVRKELMDKMFKELERSKAVYEVV